MSLTRIVLLGLALSVGLAVGGHAQDRSADKESQKFIKTAIQGNLAEIDVGKLAQQKGKSDEAKKFGQMLVTDHSKANDDAKAAASKVGVEPPSGSSIGQKATYAKLKLLTGGAFDKSFANSMVSDHEKDIKEYQKAATKNDAVGEYAKQTLPHLQKHLQEAKALQQELNRRRTSKK